MGGETAEAVSLEIFSRLVVNGIGRGMGVVVVAARQTWNLSAGLKECHREAWEV